MLSFVKQICYGMIMLTLLEPSGQFLKRNRSNCWCLLGSRSSPGASVEEDVFFCVLLLLPRLLPRLFLLLGLWFSILIRSMLSSWDWFVVLCAVLGRSAPVGCAQFGSVGSLVHHL